MPQRTGVTAKLEWLGRRLWEDGMNDREIAKEVGCAKSTVVSWRLSRGLTRVESNRNRFISGQVITIDLWERGLSDTDAARMLGIRRHTFSMRRRRLGLPINRKSVNTVR